VPRRVVHSEAVPVAEEERSSGPQLVGNFSDVTQLKSLVPKEDVCINVCLASGLTGKLRLVVRCLELTSHGLLKF
jgi:hypothetical protein